MKPLLPLIFIVILSSCQITGSAVREVPKDEHFNYTVLFCGNCLDTLSHYIANSDNTACALYNADKSVIKAINDKNKLITDNDNKISNNDALKRKSSGLMHNKIG